VEWREDDVGRLAPYVFSLASVLGDAEPYRVDAKIDHRHDSAVREDGELSLGEPESVVEELEPSLFQSSPGWLDAEPRVLLSASDVLREAHVECKPGTLVASLQLYVRFEKTLRLLEHHDGFSKQKARCSKSHVHRWLAIVGCWPALVRSYDPLDVFDLSQVGCKRSTLRCKRSTVGCKRSTVGCKRSTVGCKRSTVGCCASIIAYCQSLIRCFESIICYFESIIGCTNNRMEKDT